MATTFCSSFWLFSVSFSLSLSATRATRALCPFRRFRHSFVRLQLYLFFGRALHFIRHSAARTFTLSLTRTRHRCHVDVAMQLGVQESRSPAPRCVPAMGGLLMRVLTENALTHTRNTHTGSGTHSFTRTRTHMRNAPGGPCCGCCRFFRVFRHQMKSAYYVKSVLLFRWRKQKK